MRITAEIHPGRRETQVDLDAGAKGLDLLRRLGLAPEGHVLIRADVPIPADDPLADGDRIRIVGVVSGGGAE